MDRFCNELGRQRLGQLSGRWADQARRRFKKIKTSRLLTALTDQQHPLIGLTIGYMIPVIPSVLVDYAGVRMKLDRGHFLLMIAGGMLPTSFCMHLAVMHCLMLISSAAAGHWSRC